MEEILKGCIVDTRYDMELDRVIVTRMYHIYYNEITGVVKVDAPFKVKHMIKLKRLLYLCEINYSNIIVGNPDI